MVGRGSIGMVVSRIEGVLIEMIISQEPKCSFALSESGQGVPTSCARCGNGVCEFRGYKFVPPPPALSVKACGCGMAGCVVTTPAPTTSFETVQGHFNDITNGRD